MSDDRDHEDELPAWRRFEEELRDSGPVEALRGVTMHGSMLLAANALALAQKSFEDAARHPLDTMNADRELRVTERLMLIAEVATRVARNLDGK